ncbi:MAG: RidA family protein [Zetaproteobacteria bacterium]|nr:RidA family protein [Zetaproteobacteria bacterium]
MKLEMVHSDDAPKAVGPYSQAIRVGNMIYSSGQIGLNPQTGAMVGESVEVQTQQVLENLDAVLMAAGSHRSKIVKATIFLQNMTDFSVINGIYATWLGDHRPARATVEVSALPLGALIEIDVIASVD